MRLISERGGVAGERRGALAVAAGALLAGLCALLVFGGAASGAATLPDGFAQSRVTGGLSGPTTMAIAPDGRLFVAEQAGTLRVVEGGRLLAAPFLDISGRIDSEGERGLLGVAFDPEFADNGHVYVYYTQKATTTTPAHNRVARFTADGNRAVPGSEKLLLRLDNLREGVNNHNGGALHFGADGKLYVAVGENNVPENSQSKKNLLGKMLRINRDGSIPKDNPYYANDNVVGKNKAIWAMGLRNPFSFAVQPGTGRIFINDVGSSERVRPVPFEEINKGVKGANYGWPIHEGPESDPAYRGPVYAYAHKDPDSGYAITGGVFYNPQTRDFPKGFVGDYLFADAPNGWVRAYDPGSDRARRFATGMAGPVDLDVGPNGNLYVLSRFSGSVERIRYSGG